MTSPSMESWVSQRPLNVGDESLCSVFSPIASHGNPTTVLRLPEWPVVERLQQLARDAGVPEATFVVVDEAGIEMRWFAGGHEVPLCGHGALAAAAVLAPGLRRGEPHPVRNLPGRLWLGHDDGQPFVAFPPAALREVPVAAFTLGMPARQVFDAGRDLLVVVEDDATLSAIHPDSDDLRRLPKVGCIVTAPCADATAAFRFFTPHAGIDEDRASGSVIPALVAFWGRDDQREFEFCQRSGSDIRIRAHLRPNVDGQAVDGPSFAGGVIVTGHVVELARRCRPDIGPIDPCVDEERQQR